MTITDVVAGIRSRVKTIDSAIGAEMAAALEAATDTIEDIPLKGLIPATIREIEQRGLALCKERLADIQAEIRRLQAEEQNTTAIIAAGVAKIEILAKHEAQMSQPAGVGSGDPSAQPAS